MKRDTAIAKLIHIAEEETGYLEKRSEYRLYDKTANAGSSNYTKYWRDIRPDYQGEPWCAAFVSWCFQEAFGKDNAQKLLKHWPYVYCPQMAALFELYTDPQPGDIVIFYRNGEFRHTGIVINTANDQFQTIEGNTSGASGIVANGGAVFRKSYSLKELGGTRFCRPDYSLLESLPESDCTGTGAMLPRETLNRIPRRTGLVMARLLNVRQWAGTENPNIISFPVLKKGTTVEICDDLKAEDGSDWYFIRIAGKFYGFVSAKYIA